MPYEDQLRIAYQGEPGAFSEAAARRIAPDAQLVACRTFEEVFASVEGGPAGYGVVPIENSIGGSIHRNYDLLLEHHLPIVGEVELPVVHHLLALPGATLEGLRRVYSHPQALAQCERFLRTLTGVEIIATYDTAGSAKLVADEHLEDAAAIASARAGEVFGLTPLASSMQDYNDNLTRFSSSAAARSTTACPTRPRLSFRCPTSRARSSRRSARSRCAASI